MGLAISLQVSGIFLQTRLNAGIIVPVIIGILQPPLGVVVLFEDFLTVRVTTGLLPLAQLPVRQERSGDDKGTRKITENKGLKAMRK